MLKMNCGLARWPLCCAAVLTLVGCALLTTAVRHRLLMVFTGALVVLLAIGPSAARAQTPNVPSFERRVEADRNALKIPGLSVIYVKFHADPADELTLVFEVQWPEEFDETYTKRIKHAVAEAVLDTLWLTINPFRGCLVRLIEFKWDTIGGSEAAVHSATLLAMSILVADGDWEQVTGRYRSYET